MESDSKKIKQSSIFIAVCSHIERIADYATNICEKTVYIVTGDYNRD